MMRVMDVREQGLIIYTVHGPVSHGEGGVVQHRAHELSHGVCPHLRSCEVTRELEPLHQGGADHRLNRNRVVPREPFSTLSAQIPDDADQLVELGHLRNVALHSLDWRAGDDALDAR